jgi:hypothetical protein
MRTLCSALLTKYSGDDLKKNEMAGAYDTYGGERRCIRGFGEEISGKEITWKTQA